MYEGNYGHVRLAQPAHVAALRLRLDARAQFPATRRAVAHLRHQLRLLHALYARPPRSAHRAAQLSPPLLGAAGAVRRLRPPNAARGRRLVAPHQRPLPLLGGRRSYLPHPVQHLAVLPRPRRRSVDRTSSRPAAHKSAREQCRPQHVASPRPRQSTIHAPRGRPAPSADLRVWRRVHPPQPRRRQLVFADRDL